MDGGQENPRAQWGPKKGRLRRRRRRRAQDHEVRNRRRSRNGRHRIGRRSWWPAADGGRRSQRRRQVPTLVLQPGHPALLDADDALVDRGQRTARQWGEVKPSEERRGRGSEAKREWWEQCRRGGVCGLFGCLGCMRFVPARILKQASAWLGGNCQIDSFSRAWLGAAMNARRLHASANVGDRGDVS